MPLVASLASFVGRELFGGSRHSGDWAGGGLIVQKRLAQATQIEKIKDNSSHAEIDKSHANRETGRH
jgi:hypothetical protein